MSTAARGIGLYFYLRRRWELIVLAAMGFTAYVLSSLLTHFLPELPSRGGLLQLCYTILPGIWFAYLISTFANADQDLLSPRSSFPGHLLTLPVRTSSLALWSMLYGIVTVPLAWLLFASLILIPHGLGAYLWWPAALLAALVTVLQAVCWYPCPLPYLRIMLLVVLVPGLSALGVLGQQQGWSNGALCAVYLSLIPVCGVIAARGLSLTRRGVQPEWAGWGSLRLPRICRMYPLATPLQAQIWMEWKQSGLAAPILVLFINLVLTGLCIAIPTHVNNPWHDPFFLFFLGIPNFEIPNNMDLAIALSLLIVLLIGGNSNFRTAHTVRADRTLQPFLATRPLNCIEIVAAKMVSSGLIVLTLWVIELIFLGGWLLTPARQGQHVATLGTLLLSTVTPHLLGSVGIVLVYLTFQSWCYGVNKLWIELYGRKWLSELSLTTWIGGWLAYPTFLWVAAHPPLAMRWLPFLSPFLCAVKLAITARIVAQLIRHRLVTTRQVTRFATLWICVAVVLFLALHHVLPGGYVTGWDLACGIVLLLPLARLSLAPLALYANRHR